MKQTKNKTLLEQIKEVPPASRGKPRTIVPDADTALAWLKGEVALHQISKAIWPDRTQSTTSTMVYLFLNHSLQEAYRQGRIKIVE